MSIRSHFTFIALIIVCPSLAYSTEIEVWHGWMNIHPCSRVEWRNDGIFGTPSPTVEWGAQEVHGYATLQVPTGSDEFLQRTAEIAQQCGVRGAAAAGAAALLTGGPGSWETFSGVFQSCMTEVGVADYIEPGFRTDSQCVW